MEIGNRIARLRKAKRWSQTDLANKIDASREAIGKYERNEAVPSVEIAKKIADAFNVTLDYLVGEGISAHFDKQTVKRLEQISNLPEDEQKTMIKVIDALLRDFTTRQAYAS